MRRTNPSSPASSGKREEPLSAHFMFTLQNRQATWEERVTALHALTAVAQSVRQSGPHETASLMRQIRLLGPALDYCISDMRSTLVKEVCACITSLVEILRAEFVLAVGDDVIPALLKRSCTTKAVIRDSSVDAAKAMFEHGVNGVSFVTARLLSRTVLDRKLPHSRRYAAARFIGMILVEDCLSGLQVIGEAVCDAIVGGCNDPHDGVRATSRENWRRLDRLDPASAREMLARVSPQVVALIRKEQSSSPLSSPRTPDSARNDPPVNKAPQMRPANAQRTFPSAAKLGFGSTSPRSPVKAAAASGPTPFKPAQRAGRVLPAMVASGAEKRGPMTTKRAALPPRPTKLGEGESELSLPGTKAFKASRPVMPRPPRRSVMPNMKIHLAKPSTTAAGDVRRRNARRSVPVMNMPLFPTDDTVPLKSHAGQRTRVAGIAGGADPAVLSKAVVSPVYESASLITETVGIDKQVASGSGRQSPYSASIPSGLPGRETVSDNSKKQMSPVTSDSTCSTDQARPLSPLLGRNLAEGSQTTTGTSSERSPPRGKSGLMRPSPDRTAIKEERGTRADDVEGTSGCKRSSETEDGMEDRQLKGDRCVNRETKDVNCMNVDTAETTRRSRPVSGQNLRKGRISYILGSNQTPEKAVSEMKTTDSTSEDLGPCENSAPQGKPSKSEEDETRASWENAGGMAVKNVSEAKATEAPKLETTADEIALLLNMSTGHDGKDTMGTSEVFGDGEDEVSRTWDAMVKDLESSIAVLGLETRQNGAEKEVRDGRVDKENEQPRDGQDEDEGSKEGKCDVGTAAGSTDGGMQKAGGAVEKVKAVEKVRMGEKSGVVGKRDGARRPGVRSVGTTRRVEGGEVGKRGVGAARRSVMVGVGGVGLRKKKKKIVLEKEVGMVVEQLGRARGARKLGWEERVKALEGFGEACKELGGKKIGVKVAEDCVGMLGDYLEEMHHKVVTGALDGLFFLVLCSEGSCGALQRALEKKDEVVRRVLGLLASSRENVRLGAGRVMQSFEVAFRPEVGVGLVMKGIKGNGNLDGRVAEMGCIQMTKGFERAEASGEGFLWKEGLLENVLKGVKIMRDDRRVGVRRGAQQVLQRVKGSLPDGAFEMACGKYSLAL